MLVDRFGFGQPPLAFLVVDTLDFEAKLGIIGTEEKIVFLALSKWYGERRFGYSHGVESGFDIERDVFP